MTFWFAAVMGALCFTAAGYLFRAWQERGWKENARPGYLHDESKKNVYAWTPDWPPAPPPFDQAQDAELRSVVAGMDVARGDAA